MRQSLAESTDYLLEELDLELSDESGFQLLSEYDPGRGSTPDVYTEYCARFAQDVLGFKFWSKQLELVYSLFAHKRSGVRSGHSTGKTGGASAIFEYWLCVLGRCVWTTAPGLEAVGRLWSQIDINRSRARRRLPGKLIVGGPNTPPRLKTGVPGLWGKGFSTNKAERAQGLHVVDLLMIADEAAGIEPHIWKAIESSMASDGVRLLVLGNPNEHRNRYWQIFCDDAVRTRWMQHHISSLDVPNITDAEREFFKTFVLPMFRTGRLDMEAIDKNRPTPVASVIEGLANFDWVIDQLTIYKDEPNVFDNRVLGDWANDDAETKVIPAHYIDAAMDLWLQLEEEEEGYPEPPRINRAFLDVAGQGNDRCALSYLRGQRFHVANWWFDRSDEGQMNIAQWVHEWVVGLPDTQKPQWLAVDVDAVGVGVFSQLSVLRRKEGGWGRCRVLKFHWGWPPSKNRRDQFTCIIDEVYWDLRQALDPSKPRQDRLAIPPHVLLQPEALTRKELYEQLNVRKYSRDIRERIKVETKESLSDRRAKSPDVGDSMAGCMFRPLIVKGASR